MGTQSQNRKFKEFINELIDGEEYYDIDMSDVIDWITSNLDPDEVFDEDALTYWADHNGFIVDEGKDE
jgi:hypothetical protein